MMSLGNELWGCAEYVDKVLAEYKAYAPDKLFSQGSNNFQFAPVTRPLDDFFSGVRFSQNRLIRGSYASCDRPFGHIQNDEPNSVHSYDRFFCSEEQPAARDKSGEIMIQYGTEAKKISADFAEPFVPHIPVISHEIGQYSIYPDYSEIELYRDPLRHRAYEEYLKQAEQAGFAPYLRDFFRASGTLAADCYRRETEAALRCENLAGFQLLDLQDFPGQGIATVGILNAFMKSKGLVRAEEWRHSCGRTVVLAELPRFVYTSGEKITFGILLSNTDPSFSADAISWDVKVKGSIIAQGSCPLTNSGGRISRGASAHFSVSCKKPEKAVLTLRAGSIINSCTLYIYPEIDVEITEKEIRYGGKRLTVVHDEKLCGSKEICIPMPAQDDIAGEYCTDFWCYGMFRGISESMGKPVPSGTLSLLVNTKSSLMKGFMEDFHTTPPWYNIVKHSFAANLNGESIVPDVWVIDNPQRGARLALLYRKKDKVICTSRLWEISSDISARHFAAGLVKGILG